MRALLLALAACGSQIAEPSLVSVTRADLVVSVEVRGELQSLDAAKIAPPPLAMNTELRIASLAPEGSEVKPGDQVVTLDGSDLDRNLEALRAEVALATQRLERQQQQSTLGRRNEELSLLEAEASARKQALKNDVPRELVASLDLREQQLDAELAQIALDQAKAQVAVSRRSDTVDLRTLVENRDSVQHRVAEVEQSKTQLVLTAPRAGTVVYGTYNGDKHKVGDSVWGTDPIVQIVGLGAMVGQGEIDEVDLARVAVNQPVTLRVDALPDLGLHGTLSTIASSVHGLSDADPRKVVRIEIAVAPTSGAGLRPGMRFRGRIETARIPGVVQLPADAVFVTADGPVAYRDRDGELERVRVELGRRTADAIEVVSGVAPGDRVSRVDPEMEVR